MKTFFNLAGRRVIARSILLVAFLSDGWTPSSRAIAAEPFVYKLPWGQVHNYPRGRVTTLYTDRADTKVVVAIRAANDEVRSFPDRERSPKSSFLSPFEYRDIGSVRVFLGRRTDVVSWHWRYSTQTRKLHFGDKMYEVSPPAIVVLSYDEQMKPTFELRPYSAEAEERLPSELGQILRNEILVPAGLGRTVLQGSDIGYER